MRHIKNYGIVKKAMKAYFDRELEQAKRAFEALNGTYGNPKCFDKDHNCYRLSKDAAYHSKGYVVTAEDVEKYLGLSTLALIPIINEEEEKHHKAKKKKRRKSDYTASRYESDFQTATDDLEDVDDIAVPAGKNQTTGKEEA